MNEPKRGSGSTLKANYTIEPTAQPQVDAQLDSANFSLEALESTVTTLLNRLIPVTGDYPDHEQMPDGESMLVPVAARINYLESRIRNVEALLSRALNALQV